MENITFTMAHPTFSEAQEFIMQSSCNDLKNGDAPYFLRIRESVRRSLQGKGDFYLKIAHNLQVRLSKEIVTDKLKLASSFYSRRVLERGASSNTDRLQAGDKDANGDMYVPYFRVFVPIEEYNVLQAIGGLKSKWNHFTWYEGRAAGDIGAFRKEKHADGTAAQMIKDAGLDVETFLPKLIVSFTPKKKKNK